MRSRSFSHRLFVLVVLLAVGLCFVEAGAQQRRNRRSRRVTNPVVTRDATDTGTPSTSTTGAGTADPRIVSTADEQSGDATTAGGGGARTGSRTAASLEEEHDSMRTRMNRLSRQVTTLTDKLTE